MALPEPFNDVEHLQTVVRRYCNRQIRADFRDLVGESGSWEPEIGTTRGAMLKGLLHEDSDPITVTAVRMMLYYFTYGKASALQAALYGIPVQDFQEQFRYHPQVKLFFMESSADTDDNYLPLRSEITFRLMDETPESITEAKAKIIANKINTHFAASSGFRWKRGRETWTYFDMRRGYRLKLFVWSETEAKKVIEQVLDIQGHAPDWDAHLNDATQRKHQNISTIPPKKRIYGKSRRLPREKPVGTVRFRWATLDIHGLMQPINLVDTTGRRRNPLVAA